MGLEVLRKAVKEDELKRLEALLARQERTVQRAFIEFLQTTTSADAIKQVADLLEGGDIEGALRFLDGYISKMATVIPAIFQNAANAEAAALAPAVNALLPTVAIAFDPTDLAAAALMREATLLFIREFTDEQRQATREALTDVMLMQGQGTAASARAFRDSIGLTSYQQGVVKNYRRLLEEGSKEAIQRDLRDRRFDPTVRRAAKTGQAIPPEQIDKMVEAYRRRFVAKRSEDIARTEGVRVTAAARAEAFRQTLVAAGLTEDDADHTWRTTRDGRERDTHRRMDGQKKPFGQPFVSPSGARLRYPGDPKAPAKEVIACRCHETFSIKPPEDRRR